MNEAGFSVRGWVLDDAAGAPLSGIRVVVHDPATALHDVMMVATTDADGMFEIEIPAAVAKRMFAGAPDISTGPSPAQLFFFNGATRIDTKTVDLTMGDLALGAFPEPFCIRRGGQRALAFSVQGRVLDAAGQGVAEVTVELAALGLSSTTPLGETVTASDGAYEIRHQGIEPSVATDPHLDARLTAKDCHGAPVGQSPILFGLSPHHRVDIVVTAAGQDFVGLTELEQLRHDLAASGPVPPLHTLAATDLELLSRRADVFPLHLGKLVQAHRLAQATEIDVDALYALLRADFPPSLSALVLSDAAQVADALDLAVRRRTVPTPQDPRAAADDVTAKLAALRIESAMLPGKGSTPSSRDLLDSSGLAESKVRAFVDASVGYRGTRDAFFADLRSNPTLASEDVDTLEFTAKGAALLGNFLPALTQLQALRRQGEVRRLDDVAAWDVPRWIEVLQTAGAPASVPGATEEARVRRYATALHSVVEAQFPTRVLSHQLQRDTAPDTEGVHAFLEANPRFAVERSIVDIFVESNDVALDPQHAANLKRVQRVYAVTPPQQRAAITQRLLTQDMGSAAQIVHQGRTAFIDRMAPALADIDDRDEGRYVAAQIYERARIRNGVAVVLLTQYAAPMHAVDIDATAFVHIQWTGPAAATLENLFGNQDYCACEHCRSQFSAAAYLVDLLSQLQAAPGVLVPTALDVLRQRRPDIPRIDLSCINTNTVLPYIDLVTELLEQLVEGVSPLQANQTSWSAEALRVQPEHVRDSAYVGADSPAEAVFPWSLPFHLPTTETRAYLATLGTPRDEAMRVLRRARPVPAGVLDAAEHADAVAEALGMTRLTLQAVCSGSAYESDLVPGPSVAQLWDVAEGAPIRNGAREVMAATELSYESLTELLAFGFISPPARPLALRFAEDRPSCDLDDISIAGLTDAAASRVHRFVRLLRHVPLTPAELNFAVLTIGEGSLNYRFVRQLESLLRLMDRLGLPLEEAVAVVSRIPTRAIGDSPSLYARLFLDASVDGVADGSFLLDDGFEVGEALVLAGQDLAGHREAIRGALRINDTDFDLLLGALGLAALNHANLSTLYRHTRLARALGLSVSDALRIWRLVDEDPFSTPVQTLAYAEAALDLAQLPLSVAEIDYVCRHRAETGADFVLGELAADDALAAIGAGVEAVDVALQIEGTADVVVAAHLAALLATPVDVGRVMALLGLTGALDAGLQTELAQRLEGAVVSTAAAVADAAAVVGPDAQSNQVARAQALLPHLASFRRDAEIDVLLAKLLGDLGQVDPMAALLLASTYTRHDGDPVRTVLLEGDAAAQREALQRWSKAALLVRALEIKPEVLAWFFGAPFGPQSFDLNAMPLAPQDEAGDLPRRVLALAWGQQFQTQLAWTGNALADARDAATVDAAVAIVAEAAGWVQADVQWAASDALLDVAPADFADPFVIRRIGEVADLSRRSGVLVAQLAQWVRGVPNAAETRLLKQAVRSRYGEAQWAAVVTPVSDRIREQKRDALVALLLARGTASSVEALYERLLVDPLMNACMLTSRIKLAISSCQLFVQRGLLGLESAAVRFSPEYSKVWWRARNYRVWEALRRVFFYPENWIEPELRLNKTPLYEAFESDLDQGELGEETVERAFRNYLYGLDEVAQLEIVSIYQEPPPGGDTGDAFWPTGTVHVVGRSRDQPRKYFYRQRVADLVWSPWEAIDLEINGDHVAVAYFNGRVLLFWVELDPIPYNDDDDVQDDLGRDYRCRLNWSERRDAGWSSQKTLERRNRQFIPSRRIVTLSVRATSTSLRVSVMRPSTTTEPTPVHLKSLWGFRYDWCLGSLIPAAFGRAERERLGLPLTRSMNGQRQLSDDTDALHMVTGWWWAAGDQEEKFGDQSPVQQSVLTNVGRDFAVTQTYQRLEYESLTPAVFDDGKHALYMVPYRTQGIPPEGIAPGDDFGLTGLDGTAAAGTSLADQPLRSSASLFAEPWGGVVPGLAARSTSPTEVSPSAAVLASTVRTATAAATITPSLTGALPANLSLGSDRSWRLDNFNHPYTCLLIKALGTGGIDGVLAGTGSLQRQRRRHRYLAPDPSGSQYDAADAALLWTDPKNEFDFRFGSAYGIYNWELFFHIPLAVAERYRREQRFEDATRWFHYIFDPVQGQVEGDPSSAARFWKNKPLFAEATQGPDDVIQAIFTGGDLDVGSAVIQTFLASVWAWLVDPLDPHGIAAVRSGTYRWVVVRKYLDTLIDWGDSLFRRDTIESINEATQLYLLAGAILGRKPERITEAQTEDRNFDELEAPALFGGLVELESFGVGTPLPPSLDPTYVNPGGAGTGLEPADDIAAAEPPPPPAPLWWYFCLPANDSLLAYWDTVADRLFKIRNCQNIDGVTRQLALFAPPIDPALLVRARAAGISIESVLSDLHGPVPIHRFRNLVARALDMCSDVRSLGGALLAALEKRDAEALAQLRAEHEVALHRRSTEVRKIQLDEASEQLVVLAAQSATVTERRDFFKNRKRVSGKESRHRKAMWAAMGLEIGAVAAKAAGAILKLASGRREWISDGLVAVAETLPIGANIARTVGQQALAQAGYERRGKDWTHTEEQADSELKHIEAQVVAAEIRIALAERELANTERQVAEAQAVDAFMSAKYTGAQLYDWMVGQLSGLYFQSYKLAFDLARQAERAMQRELHTEDSFVRFDAWDNLKQGLLAGERLQLDLRRLEAGHRALDRREYELNKRVSLRAIDAGALVDLREDGACVFELPEVLFDLDHPGHYLRRIKSVSLTIPAVVGPHTSVGARLVLERHRTRVDASAAGSYAEQEDDPRFEYGFGGPQTIATSQAREDAGLFELNLSDERRLPFEGSGVISRWRIQLPAAHRQFDYTSIADVQLQIAYTAREGGDGLRAQVEGAMAEQINAAAAQLEAAAATEGGLTLMLHAGKDFPVDWERFLRPTGESLTTLSVPIIQERFPHVLRRPELTATGVEFVAVPRAGTSPLGNERTVVLSAGAGPGTPIVLAAGDVPRGSATFTQAVTDTPWVLDVSDLDVQAPDDLLDLVLLVHFSI